jgi:hypothetical protein
MNLLRSQEGVETAGLDLAPKILDSEGRHLFLPVFWLCIICIHIHHN